MRIFGITKGTEVEMEIDKFWKGEEQAAGMYAALAFIAKARGLEEVSDTLMKVAVDELSHAGFYAVLNGHSNEDIFEVLKKMAPLESGGAEKINEFANHVRNLGLEEAAVKIESIALDEGRHGETLKNLVEQFSNKK